MNKKDKEILESIIKNNNSKDDLAHVDIKKCRELIMDAGAILLDVRPPAKVSGENAQEAGIKNAIFTPITEFSDYIDQIPSDHTTPIVIACLKGWFANRAKGYLDMLGYENVYVLGANIEDLIEVHHAHAG